MLDAPRNLSSISSQRTSTEESLEETRRNQRAVWFVLALIASAEVAFGMWLVNLISAR